MMHPIQDNSDLGRLVRRIGKPDETNVVAFRKGPRYEPLSAEQALVYWMLNLPDAAGVAQAARYALRHADARADNSPEVARFCDYLRQSITALDDHSVDMILREARSHYAWQDRPVPVKLLHAIYDITAAGPTETLSARLAWGEIVAEASTPEIGGCSMP